VINLTGILLITVAVLFGLYLSVGFRDPRLLGFSLTAFIICLAAAATGLGVILRRNWARVSLFVVLGLWALSGVGCAVAMSPIWRQIFSSPNSGSLIFGMGLFIFFMVVLPVLGIQYFRRSDIKKQFTAFLMYVVCSIMLAADARATDQMYETLIYQGERYGMSEEPLERYFDQNHQRPDFQPSCTGELKGYHGVWEVKDGALYLVKVQEPCPSLDAPDTFGKTIFNGKPLPVPASWVTGTLTAGDWEKRFILTIQEGKLVKEEREETPFYRQTMFLPPDEVPPLEMGQP
jgi:hypothetical protein